MSILRTSISRRAFLRSTGVALTLPWLEAMTPRSRAAAAASEPPRRLICMNASLGIHTPNLFPTKAGADYELTPYLDAIKAFRNDFTVFSGLSHPEVDGGHTTELCYLTAAMHPTADGFKNTISLDQFAVERLRPDTRLGTLTLASSHNGLSITRGGVQIPPEQRPSRLFKNMFVDGTPTEVAAQIQKIKQGRSVMDAVQDEADAFQKTLGANDRRKLDEYFNSVREVEQRMLQAEEWARRPKPKVDAKAPVDVANSHEIVARVELMIDMMHLALQTDSTRFITFALNGFNAVPVGISGVTQDWHNLSHHGQDPEKLAELRIVELQQMQLFGRLLEKLKSTPEAGGTLLDRTIVQFGSNLGNASSHDNKNMPIVVAGGGFRHGKHLAFDPKKNPPLSNLYVQYLQRLGADVDTFGSSTGTSIPGFEPA